MTVRMLTLCSLFVCLAGCNRSVTPDAPSAAPATKTVGGVAVVDLDSVARQLGRDAEMNRAVQERLTALNGKLATLRTSLARLYEEKLAGFGESPDADQQQELQAMQERMEAQLIESRRKAENELAVYKQQMIDEFRDEARPILRDVAADRGLSIVIPKNHGLLLSIDPDAEITDEVARRMSATGATRSEKTTAKPNESDSSATSSR